VARLKARPFKNLSYFSYQMPKTYPYRLHQKEREPENRPPVIHKTKLTK